METILDSPYMHLLIKPDVTSKELDGAFEAFVMTVMDFCLKNNNSPKLYFLLNYIKILLVKEENRHITCQTTIHLAVLYIESIITWVLNASHANLSSTEPPLSSGNSNVILQWSSDIIDLVELIYAFHTIKLFNDGNITLKDLNSNIGKMFGMDIGNLSGLYARIRQRKAEDRAYFINRLREALLKRMEEDDDRHYQRNK